MGTNGIIQSDKNGNRLLLSLRDRTIHKLTRVGQTIDKVCSLNLHNYVEMHRSFH